MKMNIFIIILAFFFSLIVIDVSAEVFTPENFEACMIAEEIVDGEILTSERYNELRYGDQKFFSIEENTKIKYYPYHCKGTECKKLSNIEVVGYYPAMHNHNNPTKCYFVSEKEEQHPVEIKNSDGTRNHYLTRKSYTVYIYDGNKFEVLKEFDDPNYLYDMPTIHTDKDKAIIDITRTPRHTKRIITSTGYGLPSKISHIYAVNDEQVHQEIHLCESESCSKIKSFDSKANEEYFQYNVLSYKDNVFYIYKTGERKKGSSQRSYGTVTIILPQRPLKVLRCDESGNCNQAFSSEKMNEYPVMFSDKYFVFTEYDLSKNPSNDYGLSSGDRGTYYLVNLKTGQKTKIFDCYSYTRSWGSYPSTSIESKYCKTDYGIINNTIYLAKDETSKKDIGQRTQRAGTGVYSTSTKTWKIDREIYKCDCSGCSKISEKEEDYRAYFDNNNQRSVDNYFKIEEQYSSESQNLYNIQPIIDHNNVKDALFSGTREYDWIKKTCKERKCFKGCTWCTPLCETEEYDCSYAKIGEKGLFYEENNRLNYIPGTENYTSYASSSYDLTPLEKEKQFYFRDIPLFYATDCKANIHSKRTICSWTKIKKNEIKQCTREGCTSFELNIPEDRMFIHEYYPVKLSASLDYQKPLVISSDIEIQGPAEGKLTNDDQDILLKTEQGSVLKIKENEISSKHSLIKTGDITANNDFDITLTENMISEAALEDDSYLRTADKEINGKSKTTFENNKIKKIELYSENSAYSDKDLILKGISLLENNKIKSLETDSEIGFGFTNNWQHQFKGEVELNYQKDKNPTEAKMNSKVQYLDTKNNIMITESESDTRSSKHIYFRAPTADEKTTGSEKAKQQGESLIFLTKENNHPSAYIFGKDVFIKINNDSISTLKDNTRAKISKTDKVNKEIFSEIKQEKFASAESFYDKGNIKTYFDMNDYIIPLVDKRSFANYNDQKAELSDNIMIDIKNRRKLTLDKQGKLRYEPSSNITKPTKIYDHNNLLSYLEEEYLKNQSDSFDNIIADPENNIHEDELYVLRFTTRKISEKENILK